ncbi:cytochrome c family protein [Promineifilum sp.]|uniref:c-type cytochrome n=1 Tax=Promineifilum sp. TaxID=2664178 RepID=UPI0035AE44DA
MTIPSTTPEPSRRKRLRLVLGGCAVLALVILFACGANAAYWTYRMRPLAAAGPAAGATPITLESLPAGDAAAGEQRFHDDAGCGACHSLEPGVGPSLAGVAARAGAPAEAYILESIVDPSAHVVEGYGDGTMPANFGQRLSAQQLADLVAFLMTQEG